VCRTLVHLWRSPEGFVAIFFAAEPKIFTSLLLNLLAASGVVI
jgi:hypothetical protein